MTWQENPFGVTPMLTVEEVAEHLQIQPSTVREYISDGLLRAFKMRAHSNRAGYRVRADDLQRFIDGLTPVQPDSDTRDVIEEVRA